jgi:NADH dehydrogenase
MSHSNVIIIGGGTAGMAVVQELHAADKYLSVTLIKDEEVTINKGALPYGIDPQKSAGKFVVPNKLVTYLGADLVVDSVQRVDPASSTVYIASGDTLTYDHLVFATGAHPAIPPIPGVDAPQVISLRSKYDLFTLRETAQSRDKVIVIGSDYVGLEVTAMLHALETSVSIVEPGTALLGGALPETMANEITQYLRDHNIDVITRLRVQEILCPNERVTGVQLEDGSIMDADRVILSLGVEPETELAQQSGIEVSKFGIVTDECLRTNYDNVYANGDCAEKKSFITGQPIRLESETSAVLMSRIVAANILGQHRTLPGFINSYAGAIFDLSYGSAGLSEAAAIADFDTFIGVSEVLTKYPMMDDARPIKTQSIFTQDTYKLIGGTVLHYGGNAAADVDYLSLAIQLGATADDIAAYQYVTHPELTAKPSDNRFVLAARDALRELGI